MKYWQLEALDLEKRNASFSSISRDIDIDKIYLYAKDANEAKYQLSINKSENSGLKQSNDAKAFIEYSNDMDGIYKIELLIRIYRFHTKSIFLVIFRLP